METYKKTLYSKKFSNDINLGAIQSRRAPWLICIDFITEWMWYEGYYLVETRLSRVLGMMLLGSLLEKLQFILHRCYYQIVFSLLVVLWLFFCCVARTFRCLWPFVDLFVGLRFWFTDFFAFCDLITLVISRSNEWFPSKGIFASDDWKLEVVGFVHFWVFGAFADGGSGESFFVPK